ncbi:MAG: LacI family DNA-binding transcriptional regulator, partial [Bacteroidales bacterium]|nr:LacI family DNA-binding transcriptional regulator [Bacteroidales bacterium]
MGRVTLKDIARKLNISISTVSRALRNKGDMNPKTRQAVIDLSKKWSYSPNPYAMYLLKSKTNTIGVIVPEISSYYFAAIIEGIEKGVSQAGYRILICFSNDNYENEVAFVNELINYHVDGLLISPSQETVDIEHFRKIINVNIPLVFFDRAFKEIDSSRVVTNNFEAAFQLTEYLLIKGYRKIAFITSMQPISVAQERYEGYLAALKKIKIPFDRSVIIHTDLRLNTAISTTRYLLELADPPDAIIGINDNLAMGA